MAMEHWLCAQFVMIRLRESDYKKEKKIQGHITSKDNHQDQDAGLILIMSG